MVDFKKMSEKESAILNSAYQIFTEKGFHNAKVSEIAQHAGVGKGTIYEYYASKEELLRGVIQIGMLHYIEEMKRYIKDSNTFWEKIENMYTAHAYFLTNHDAFKKVIGDHFSVINKEFHDWMLIQRNQLIELVKEIVEEGMDKGEIASGQKDWTATFILTSMMGLQDCQDSDDSKGKVDFVVNILKNGLKQRNGD